MKYKIIMIMLLVTFVSTSHSNPLVQMGGESRNSGDQITKARCTSCNATSTFVYVPESNLHNQFNYGKSEKLMQKATRATHDYQEYKSWKSGIAKGRYSIDKVDYPMDCPHCGR